MQRQFAKLNSLLGLDRNRVTPGGEIAPQHLVNLSDARGGGYVPAGAWRSVADDSWSGFPTFVGSDALGLASVRSGATGGSYRYGLVRDAEFVQGSLLGGAGAASHYGAHIPGVGAYASRNRFLVQDRSGNIVEPTDFTGAGFTPAGVSSASGEPVYDQAGLFPIIDMGYDAVLERVVAVGHAGSFFHFAYRDEGETWVTGRVLVTVGRQVRALARTASMWVAVGSGGLVMRSPDGATWTDDSTGSHNFIDVTADPLSGRVWAAVGNATPGPVSTRALQASNDSGATWNSFDPGGWLAGLVEDHNFYGAVAYDVASDGLAVVTVWGIPPDLPAYFKVWDFGINDYRGIVGDWGGSDVWLWEMPGGLAGGGSSTIGIELGPGGRALVYTNRLTYSGAPNPAGAALAEVSTTAGGNPVRSKFPDWTDDSASTYLDDATWSGDQWVLVGRGGNYLMGTAGSEWVEAEFASGDNYRAVVSVGSSVIAGGGNGVVAEWSPTGAMSLGRYEALFLTSVMTAAGKLVVDVREADFRVVEPSARVVNAHRFSPEPDFTENVTTDVYVRFTPRVFDEESGQWVIHEPVGGYTHAASLSDGQSWDVDAPGVGSQVLGISGGVAVAAFRNSDGANVSAEHNARVWFQSGPGFAWDVLMGAFDFPMLEDERVVTFSVGGFVNLVELDGWLRLAATQSDSLTGMLPSPQGLLIFFDNETFSLSGDVALQNLQALLFPDNVGLTAGNKAVLAGGVPISLWRGKLWALQGGQAQDVAAPVWRADDPFVDAASDPLTRSIVALTEAGEVLVLRTDSGFWFELPPLPPGAGSPQRLAGNPTGFRVWMAVSSTVTPRSFDSDPVTAATPEIAWLNLDVGDAMRRDSWLSVRFTTESATDGGSVAEAPVLYYRPTDSGSAPSVFTRNASYRVVGRRFGQEWRFRLPARVKSRRLDALIVLTGFEAGAVIEPGVLFEFIPGQQSDRVASV